MERIYNGPGAVVRAEAGGNAFAEGRYDSNTSTPAALQAPALYPYQIEVIERVDAAIAAGKLRAC